MLSKHETVLVGNWLGHGSEMSSDETCRRIEELIASHLIKVGSSPDGWSALYEDPSDRRLWELWYPHAEWHGGGPPAMRCVSRADAATKYGPVREDGKGR
jgi:hypothetical protein